MTSPFWYLFDLKYTYKWTFHDEWRKLFHHQVLFKIVFMFYFELQM